MTKDEYESESDDSEISDIDYELSKNDMNYFSEFNVTKERIQYLWNKQSGLCAVSNLPLTLIPNTLYSVTIVPRKITDNISDMNSMLVCNVYNTMREASGLTWTQFKTFCNTIE